MNDICTTCGLAAWGVVRIPLSEIPRWRKDPGPSEGLSALPNLKLADEQTVVAMAAVLQACQRAGWAPTSFRDWGVLAAPRYLGRVRLAQNFVRYGRQGVRGVSPLVIPTISQHAVAGTLCLILGCHGPNFGIGGACETLGEALLNSLSILDEQRCAGIWAVMTAWNPEPVPDNSGQTLAPTTGIGVALALTPQRGDGAMRLRISNTPEHAANQDAGLFELADFLERPGDESSWRWMVPGAGVLEIVPPGISASSLPLRLAG